MIVPRPNAAVALPIQRNRLIKVERTVKRTLLLAVLTPSLPLPPICIDWGSSAHSGSAVCSFKAAARPSAQLHRFNKAPYLR
jgi:hypothetical protein